MVAFLIFMLLMGMIFFLNTTIFVFILFFMVGAVVLSLFFGFIIMVLKLLLTPSVLAFIAFCITAGLVWKYFIKPKNERAK